LALLGLEYLAFDGGKLVLEIPYEELSEEALQGVLEEFVTRGGYESDMVVEERIRKLRQRLEQGKAKIVFDPEQGATNLVSL
jgi:uncharacterized protein YheU (UPF0270 family)